MTQGSNVDSWKGGNVKLFLEVETQYAELLETELVTADMYMPEMLWSLYFIGAKGNSVECVELYQDNIITQLLIKNGKFSSGKKTKHVKAKFFFVKSRLDDAEIKVLDCPAEEMWVNALTKPLQWMAFRIIQSALMNCPVNYEDNVNAQQTATKDNSMVKSITQHSPMQNRSVLDGTG
jgi:hypothetical protein